MKMVRAHSMLYAIYICLIVAVICGALLYISTLYTQLNLYYNLGEDLYLQNQSYVNFALGTEQQAEEGGEDSDTGVSYLFANKNYGILNLLQVQTWTRADTVSSLHLTGSFSNDKTCLFVAHLGNPFYYSGTVKLVGEKKFQTDRVQEKYLKNEKNSFNAPGSIKLSTPDLPELNPAISRFYEDDIAKKVRLKDLERNGSSIYFNSFAAETICILLPGSTLENVVIKGNFVIQAKDSVVIKSNAVLQDVIVKAPKIIVESTFRGSAQLFATEVIDIGEDVELGYPSLLCVRSKESGKANIEVNEKARISGAVVLYDDSRPQSENTLVLSKESLVRGEVYCTGKLMVEGKVYGSVYTNKIFHKTAVSVVDNCLVNAEIDVTERPSYFVSLPILKTNKKKNNAIFKKVL